MTGINSDWTTSADTCTEWTSMAGNYTAGNATQTSNATLNNGSAESCATQKPLICVEQ